jgi:Zn ribbon nucleic-acid-binding protein
VDHAWREEGVDTKECATCVVEERECEGTF